MAVLSFRSAIELEIYRVESSPAAPQSLEQYRHQRQGIVQIFIAPQLPSGFWYQGNLGPTTTHGVEQVIQPSAYPFLILLTLVYSCFALLACDALAERLQVPRSRRAFLAVAEAVVLWNVTIIFGHPEDAVAVGFAIYALIFAFDERFVGAAWLFGLALAFQPLAIVTLPILLAIAGRKRVVGMVVRGVVPAALRDRPTSVRLDPQHLPRARFATDISRSEQCPPHALDVSGAQVGRHRKRHEGGRRAHLASPCSLWQLSSGGGRGGGARGRR